MVHRDDGDGGDVDPEPLELGRVRALADPVLGTGSGHHRTDPSRRLVVAQALLALGLLLAGAHFFVEAVTWLATAVLDLPAVVVALLLAPLVSNVPENVDGVIWIREGEDALAVEQVTGTLAFQGTVVAALGVAFTPWDLSIAWGTADFLVATAALLAVVTGGLFYRLVRAVNGRLSPRLLVGFGLPYGLFLAVTAYYAVVGHV